MALIHPTALVDPKAELDSVGRRSAPYSDHRPARAHRRRHHGRPARGDRRPHDASAATTGFSSSARSARRRRTRNMPASRPRLEIGDRNTIREFCTFNLGTVQDAGVTRAWQRQLDLGLRAHRARLPGRQQHDLLQQCAAGRPRAYRRLGDLGRLRRVHQFCKIGAHGMTAIGTVVLQGDIPPFVTASGDAQPSGGINSEGLKRRGFSTDAIALIKRASSTLPSGPQA